MTLTTATEKGPGHYKTSQTRHTLPALSSDHKKNGKSKRQLVIMCHHITSYQMVLNVASHILRFPWLSAELSVTSVAFNVARKFSMLVLDCPIITCLQAFTHIRHSLLCGSAYVPKTLKKDRNTQNWNMSTSKSYRHSLLTSATKI